MIVTYLERLEPRRVFALPTPTGLFASVNSSENVVLTWDDVSGEAGYRLEARPQGPNNWATLITLGSNVVTYTDTSADRLTSYYRIVATGAQPSDESPLSERIFPETDYDDPVQVEYVGGSSPKLVWDANLHQTTGYKVHKKVFGPVGNLGNRWYWDDLTSSGPLPATATEFPVTMTSGSSAEFRVSRLNTSFGFSDLTGFVLAGEQAPAIHSRGTILVVVDESQFDTSRSGGVTLRPEIDRYKSDLVAEGWTVREILAPRYDIPRVDLGANPSAGTVQATFGAYDDSVQATKASVRNAYDSTVKAIVLVGHVAVPYSGAHNPDGHPDHFGAWPADAYYGTLDDESVWSDSVRNTRNTRFPENSNYPGDGRFDQTDINSMGSSFSTSIAVDVPVGRIDFWGMDDIGTATRTSLDEPAPAVETLALKTYFAKNHVFRTRTPVSGQPEFDGLASGVSRQAAIAQNFPNSEAVQEPERFSANVGAANVESATFSDLNPAGGYDDHDLANQSWLWAYGGGPGEGVNPSDHDFITLPTPQGNYDSSNYSDSTRGPHRAVFNILYGSYIGDWDKRNSLMRSPLAEPDGYGLASAWGGRPQWFTHRMGLGEPLGDSLLVTLNNVAGLFSDRIFYNHLYGSDFGGVHASLLGDPTLRQDNVKPASNVQRTGSNGKTITWTASAGTGVAGYYVYRAENATSPFVLLNTTKVVGTSYTDPTSGTPSDNVRYMVRATKLESTPSGTYWNLSTGIRTTKPLTSASHTFYAYDAPHYYYLAFATAFNNQPMAVDASKVSVSGTRRNADGTLTENVTLTQGASYDYTVAQNGSSTWRITFNASRNHGGSPLSLLPNGRWTITVDGAAKNEWGEAMGTNSSEEVFFLLGDLDGNLFVDQTDLDMLESNRDITFADDNLHFGDLDDDGDVDDDDKDILMALFGAEIP